MFSNTDACGGEGDDIEQLPQLFFGSERSSEEMQNRKEKCTNRLLTKSHGPFQRNILHTWW